jgi:hypothetical protein
LHAIVISKRYINMCVKDCPFNGVSISSRCSVVVKIESLSFYPRQVVSSSFYNTTNIAENCWVDVTQQSPTPSFIINILHWVYNVCGTNCCFTGYFVTMNRLFPRLSTTLRKKVTTGKRRGAATMFFIINFCRWFF